jgi:NAD(P)-dependent dehydrogenase (short-subunit alcohol dehydrogenase family)
MDIVVVTGSTRGIGFGLAEAFLQMGSAIVVNGRTEEAVQKAVDDLAGRYGAERVIGKAADVREYMQMQALWETAKARFGRVDMWVNNAGIAHELSAFWDHPPERIRAVVETNVIGTMNGSAVALHEMRKQGFGKLYNLEGFGSGGGRMVRGLAIYGSTKAATHFLNRALMDEVSGTSLVVGAVRPGMVITDMLTGQFKERPEEWERMKRVMSLFASRVEDTAPELARMMLHNCKNGIILRSGGTSRILRRLATAPFRRRQQNVGQCPTR